MTDCNLSHLCPELQAIYPEWWKRCMAAFPPGVTTRAVVTWRNASDQNAAKAAGLSNASAGQSPHNCCNADGTPASRAFDFGLFLNGHYITDGTDPLYLQAGEIGEELGLVWGGRWTRADFDHLELKE